MPSLQNTVLVLSHRKNDLPDNAVGVKGGEDLAAFARWLEAAAGGMLSKVAVDVLRGSTDAHPQVARGTATAAAVAGADTVTLNGQVLTATQHHSRGTVTLATVSVDDTVTINGVVFTAKAAASIADRQFSQAGTDTANATSLVAVINGCTHASISGIVTATSSAGVVTIRAVTAGTGGNAITLASSNGVRLAVSGANLTAGAAVAEGEFDFGGSDTETATALTLAVNSHTNALLTGLVSASNIRARVTCGTGVDVGDTLTVAGVKFEMVLAAVDREGMGTMGTVVVSATANTMASNLATAMNAHPMFSRAFIAIANSAVVSIFAKSNAVPTDNSVLTSDATDLTATDASFAASAVVCVFANMPCKLGNTQTLASSNGTRLAVSGARLTGGVGGDPDNLPRSFVR